VIHRALPGAVVLVLAIAAAAAAVVRTSPEPPSAGEDETTAAARRFLARYVDDDGRVVRIDEGGDTVSEGQAYAMLLAVVAGDRERFDAAWTWTREHLTRPDGLLSWRWAEGAVADASPAADADVDAAHALVLASRRFRAPAYRDAGRRLAGAVLAHETIERGGRIVLAAGPWARQEGTVNPSYLSPDGFRALGAATGDPAWDRLAAHAPELLRSLLVSSGDGLPTDWATATADGRLAPAPPPGQGGAAPSGYGYDAARTVVRLAVDCDPAGRRLAAGLWPALRERQRDGGHPVFLVAAASAARAAGDAPAAGDLLDRAAATDRQRPTYYGAAWVGLGRALLTTDRLGGCA
jgi:endoglucanase